MSLQTQIARRYLLNKGDNRLGFLLAAIGFIGVLMSVFSLLLIQFVMNGFSQDLRSKILRFSSPLVLTPLQNELFAGKEIPQLPENFQSHPMHPFLETEGVIRTEEDSAQGLKIKGISLEDPILKDRLNVIYGEGETKEDLLSKGDILPGVLLGSELAKRINVFAGLNEEVDLIYPFGDIDPSGEMRPKIRRFKVIGTFKSGYYEYDNKFAIIALPEARRLVPAREVPTQWALQIPNLFDAPKISQQLQQKLSGLYEVESWGDHNKKLLSALKIERLTMWLVLSLMIVISTFNIFSLVMMIVVDKQKEIAILRAMGMPQKKVISLFTRIGLLLGWGGALAGSACAVGAALILEKFPIKVPTPYYLDSLPIEINIWSLVLVLLLAPLLSFFAAWYPANRGGRFDISDSLRYE